MHQAPGSRLRAQLLEMGKKGLVRQVLQAGSIIGHNVGLSWDVLSDMTVAVAALMVTRVHALVSGRANGGGCAFVHSGDCQGVVTECEDGGAPGFVLLANEGQLAKDACLFQIAVGDGSFGVVRAN